MPEPLSPERIEKMATSLRTKGMLAQRDGLDLLDALATSQATVAELRRALRDEVVITNRHGEHLCLLCWDRWFHSLPEQHAPGCMAALPSEPEA